MRLANLYERYETTVSLLKEHGWWKLRSGQYFHTLLIHTLPPPSLKYLSQLLDALAKCQLNTDWAPLKQTLYWKKKLGTVVNDEQEEQKESGEIAKLYPIFYGVRGISKLQWPLEKKRELIEEFVSSLIARTRGADHLHLDGYYHDVYILRDVLIDSYAGPHLPVRKATRTNLRDKIERATQVLNRYRYPGEHDKLTVVSKRGFFLEDPPFIPFIVSKAVTAEPFHKAQTNKNKRSAQIKKPDKEQLDRPIPYWTPNTKGAYSSQQQFEARKKIRANYLRNNVRSMADPNQLIMPTFVAYWRGLVGTKYQPLLALNVAALLTGIRRDRWLNMIHGDSSQLTKTNVVLSHKPSALTYRVIKGASNFSDQPIASTEIIDLPISQRLATDLKRAIDSNACNQHYPVRAFAKSYSGPSPTINRAANSGETLLRRHYFSESEMGVLSGKIPIQFQARNCYVSRDREPLTKRFHDMSTALWKTLKKHLKSSEPLFALLKDYLNVNPVAIYSSTPVGSQLGQLNSCTPLEKLKYPSLMIRPNNLTQVDQMMQAANLLELHLYWMQQYAFAQRPVGDASSSVYLDGYRLHSDKASAHFSETKLVKVPLLIQQQVKENRACRETLIKQIRRAGYPVRMKANSAHKAWYFERTSSLKRCVVSPMHNALALELAKTHWGYSPSIDRPNISRHQCASMAHRETNEILADIWLGHHIDGWDPYAPESSLATTALDSLEELQACHLSHLGFRVMRNPLV